MPLIAEALPLLIACRSQRALQGRQHARFSLLIPVGRPAWTFAVVFVIGQAYELYLTSFV